MKKIIFIACSTICLITFFICGYHLLEEYTIRNRDNQLYADLSVQVQTFATQNPIEDEFALESDESSSLTYQEMLAKNKDMIGWISIPNTILNYPVMYTPDDPVFYLSHNFYKEYSFSGTPFLDANCSLEPQSNHLILYGHNMINNTMFSSILNYQNSTFKEEHPYVSLYIGEVEYAYEVIFVFYQEADGETWTNGYFTYTTEDEFVIFQDHCKNQDILGGMAEIQYTDSLLSLITCSNSDENTRFVVVAKEISK